MTTTATVNVFNFQTKEIEALNIVFEKTNPKKLLKILPELNVKNILNIKGHDGNKEICCELFLADTLIAVFDSSEWHSGFEYDFQDENIFSYSDHEEDMLVLKHNGKGYSISETEMKEAIFLLAHKKG